MINTVTLNPSLDYIVKVKDFSLGHTNRSEEEEIYPGGKGINVATVAKNLGQEVRAFGFLAGFTGKELQRRIGEKGLRDEFVILEKGLTRINIKLKSGEETEVNGQGPDISREELEKLYEKLEKLDNGEYLVLAGSIPSTLPKDIYKTIMEKFAYKKFNFVVDATGELLLNVLELKPFLVKPNIHELEEIFGEKIDSVEEVAVHGRKLQALGAKNVIVSMGKDGALILTQTGKIITRTVPKGKLINSVGAGDSMVAGFLAKFIETQDYEQAFKWAVASGSATAFSKDLATKEEVNQLIDTME